MTLTVASCKHLVTFVPLLAPNPGDATAYVYYKAKILSMVLVARVVYIVCRSAREISFTVRSVTALLSKTDVPVYTI